MPFVVEKNETADPVEISLLGARDEFLRKLISEEYRATPLESTSAEHPRNRAAL